jgi:type I restriction enzyme S subunit
VTVRESERVDSTWLGYILAAPSTRVKISARATGTGAGMKNISKEALLRIEIDLPSFEAQKAMVRILSAWDPAIEQTERLIAAKRRCKQALMQQLLTGKRRYNGSWRKMRLREVFEPVYRRVTPNVGAVLSISSRKGFERQEDKFSKVIAGKNLDNYVLLQKGEFAYNKGNSKTYPQGCVFRLDDHGEAAVPNVYFCFATRDDTQADSGFYSQYFQAGLLNEGLRGLINTGVRNNGLLNIYEDDFYELSILLPPIEEQRKIAGLLWCCDREIEAFCRKLDALKAQKKGLMRQLLAGEVQLRI